MSTPSLKSSLIRIWSKEPPDKLPFIVGAGFVVTPEHAFTCAHVINSALGREEKDPRKPHLPIFIDFFGSDNPIITATVLRWFPVRENDESDELEDIAVLKLIDPLPAGISSVSFAKASEQVDRVRMCGFPGDAQHGTYLTGMLTGMVQGAIKNGWIELHPEDNRSADPGFSGTAAWDMEQYTVCGMIVSRQIRAGGIHNVYMIPAEKLMKAIPDMNKNIFSKGHALIIGVQTYSSPLGDLPCTLEDVKALAGVFKDKERCAYPPEQVTRLTDSEADRNGILVALDRLAKVTDAESTVVIYFSGHGGTRDGGYYFCPYGFNPAKLEETAISESELKCKIDAIPAKKKLVLLDCCHAGGVGGVKGESLMKTAVPPEAIELFGQGKGCVVIGASREDEVSYVGDPCSVFTGALIEALCGQGVAKKDGYVRAADLAMYTRERVPQLTKDKPKQQHPVLHFEQADNFVLAHYAGGEGTPKSVPFTLEVDDSEQDEREQVKPLAESIRVVEEKYIKADYMEAYENLYSLCRDRQDCEQFSPAAMSILAQYNDLEKSISSMTLDLSQQEIRKREISTAFTTLLNRMKRLG